MTIILNTNFEDVTYKTKRYVLISSAGITVKGALNITRMNHTKWMAL